MKEKFNSNTFKHSLWSLRDEDLVDVLKKCVQVQYLLFQSPGKTEERNLDQNGSAGFLKTGLQKNA